ncbi:DUF1569 domain-containing protein [Chitinophaga lutea]|uniref:DUF1569 domain-containing protein n=1 Tax=Chitinophaga lutea TaxID=2488634 RepID=A0A3N4Q4N1_9BACT|nr:DUF1569 domain-containing protein [Chitinophaga lutea]RPE12431.1 DUF1569 domain-containing protein [Chitinophaga lutea]
MELPNIFTQPVAQDIIRRINLLQPGTTAQWGKMNAGQMLAHCNVQYELVYDDNHPKPGFVMRFILRSFVKKIVTSAQPYKQNAQTAPAFIIKGDRDFDREKTRLIGYIRQTAELGEHAFEGKVSHSFGALSKNQWNNLFYKHLNHHLTQFGV